MPFLDLPTELLIHILASACSLTDLRTLAFTSRRTYAIFQDEQAALIYQALANELGPVIDDALGLSDLEAFGLAAPDYFNDDYRAALTKYGGYLSGHGHPSPRQLPLDYVLRLVRSYRAMSELSGMYITSAFNLIKREALPSSVPTTPPGLTAAPSRSEWLRVLRAHYRLQMARSSYHAGASAIEAKSIEDARNGKALLFELWGPWEVQQIFSVGGLYKRLEHRLIHSPNIDMSKESWFTLPLDGWLESLKRLQRTNEAGFPTALRFDGDDVAAVPFAWVDAFDGYYGYHYWGVMPGIKRGGQAAQGLWSLFGFVLWDAPRVEALKTASFLLCCNTGWLSSSSRQ
ncbi:uncharacterized protein B0H64DRAFT_363203 [Chaetomium fimeti]|uniref:F-box domain-containing protein n=1 Tax=Chaetomium fimeti TaxID=1854472 RepID=A0AAE0HAF1_9PEZI|nr:hypothetical protein B0H64DRAFT_363203 [Chaetomium fimeti]